MFCPRAMRRLLGVGVCAVMAGCAASASPVTQMPLDSQLASSTLLASDTAARPRMNIVEADSAISLTRPVSVEDIVNWSIRGTSDDVIIDRIEHSSNSFRLSPSQEIHLHDAGVSDEVIHAMKATAN